MALREVLAEFDVDTGKAESKLKSFDGHMANVAGTLGALVDHFAGSAIVHGIREFISGQIEAGSRVNDLSERLGVGTDDLQKFQFAAGLSGVGAEEAAKGLQFLNKNMGMALEGNKEAVETFTKLGVAMKDGEGNVRELGDVIPEVADAFEQMGSDQERTAAAMKIFGKSGAGLLPLLKGGAHGLKELSEEFDRLGGGMSEGFVKAADSAGDEIDKLKFAMNGWKSQIAMVILPLIERGAKKLQGWMGMLRKVTGETRLASLVWGVFGIASAGASAKAAVGFSKLLGVVPKDASFWKAALGLGEIALVIAAIAILVLIFEDLFTFLEGGDSVIGDVIESLFGVGAAQGVIDEVRNAFAEFRSELEAFQPIVEEFGALFGDIWREAIPWIKLVAKFIIGSAGTQLAVFLKLVRELMGELGAGLRLFGEFAFNAGEFLGSDKIKNVGLAIAKTGVGISTATTPRSALDGAERPMRGDVTQNNDTTINITGVKDAAGAGDAANRGMREAIQEYDLDNTLSAVETGG